MHMFLTQVVARVVGLYLFVETLKIIHRGLSTGTIRTFNNDILSDFLGLSVTRVTKNRSPFLYWLTVLVQSTILLSCLAVAIFGWFPSE